MSRWLQRISSGSRVPKAVSGSNCSKKEVYAQTTTKAGITTRCHELFLSDNGLDDREDELCRRSYQLVVLKLQLSERETSLTQVRYSSPIHNGED